MSEFDRMSRILSDTGLYSAEQGSVVYAELMAYAEGLDMFFGEAEELLRECFVSTAESYGITLREALFHRVRFNSTLQETAFSPYKIRHSDSGKAQQTFSRFVGRAEGFQYRRNAENM